MKKVILGKTGLFISEICFGSLVIGPLQANLSIDEGTQVILHALDMGINFIDTAEIYQTYGYVKEAVRKRPGELIVASKSYAYDRDGAMKSIEKARKEMDMDVIDIFMLHEQESRLTLKGHREAMEYYLEAKQRGIIRAVGVSTHRIEVVEAACDMPEIDVIHPLVNYTGLGIGDGTVEQMLSAIKRAYDMGLGVYSMKALGGGNLLSNYHIALEFIRNIPFIHGVALGMKTCNEVDTNCKAFSNEEFLHTFRLNPKEASKALHIESWCVSCQKCISRCQQDALYLDNKKIGVHNDKCVLCGYCGSICPEFAIKIC